MRFKNLEKFRKGGTRSRMQLAVPVPKTPDGRVYRRSPNEQAHPRHFVLGDVAADFVIDPDKRKRMKEEPRSPQTVCPYSGTIAPDNDFLHPDDREAAIKMVKHAALEDVHDAFHNMFTDMKRRQRPGSPVQIKTSPRRPRMKPRFGRRDLLRELVCDHCGRDYGVYAIALFCPDCGAPNLRLHFAREIALVLEQVSLAESRSDNEELAYRLLGNAHEDVLTAFEATLKTVYLYRFALLPPEAPKPKPVKNDFQNVERAQKRYAAFTFDPFGCLDAADKVTLGLNIQKRHLIGHNLGVVDEKFMEHAADAKLGETVALVGSDIRDFASLCQRVIERIDDWLVDGKAPGPEESGTPMDGEDQSAPDNSTEPAETVGDLGPLATALARWLCGNSEDGMCWPVREELLNEAFPDAQTDALAEAIAELEADGFATSSHSIKGGLPRFRPTPELFIEFDPLVLNTDPVADAQQLIARILDGGENVSVPDLHEQTGWSLRRFNPALSLVLDRIDERRVSQENDMRYLARSFALMATDRVELKRLAKELGG